MDSVERKIKTLQLLLKPLVEQTGVRFKVANSWHFAPDTNTISIDKKDVELRDEIFLAGVLVHEVGHLLISRYNRFFSIDAKPYRRLIANVFEDPRVNNYMRQRFPGTCDWLSTLYSNFHGSDRRQPATVQFIQNAIVLAEKLDVQGDICSEVQNALMNCENERGFYTNCFSLPNKDYTQLEHQSYLCIVWPNISAKWRTLHRNNAELKVELEAYSAYEKLIKIEEEFEQLFTRDVQVIANAISQNDKLRKTVEMGLKFDAALTKLAVSSIFQESFEIGASRSNDTQIRKTAERALLMFLDLLYPTHPLSRLIRAAMQGTFKRNRQKPSDGEQQKTKNKDALINASNQQQQVNFLKCKFIDVLPRHRFERTNECSYFGKKLCISQVMQARANHSSLQRIWYSESIPNKPDISLAVLVDCSGSMSGEKIQYAVAALKLIALAVLDLPISFGIWGFQDILIEVKPFTQNAVKHNDELFEWLLEETNGSREGGNNYTQGNDDGPCLRELAEIVDAQSTLDKTIIVISDGCPNGRRSITEDLRDSVAWTRQRGIKLVGLGIGNATEHVDDFYAPSSRSNIDLTSFAEVLCDEVAHCFA